MWITASAPKRARSPATAARSARSAVDSVAGGRTDARCPFDRLSMTRTSCPSRWSTSLTTLPMYPAPPVTATRMCLPRVRSWSRRGHLPSRDARHARVEGQRLRDDLVHVVVLVGAQPAEEVHAWRRLGELLVL